MVDFYNHVKHCTTHPKFLHSNSTSHRWVFGAIAELIDNAIDPDVSASQFCIDMKEFDGEPCLVFMDNGCGLVPERLHKMLSFGHSKKQLTPGDRSIGKHGNGFKSGTMRLGKDVLVLTKCANSMTAGFLSQTFLADTGAEDILIPQVSWNLNGRRLSPLDLEIEESLRAICKYSIFPDEESLLAQLEAIPVTGAILIISNLRRHEGVLELDFDTDPHDIRITSEINSSHFQQLRPNQPNTTEVPMDYSLRAYVSILYKVPRMQIFIRDKKVKTKRIAGILSQKETESYKPCGVAESITIELGFNTENKNLYGMMLYHRNRLIKAYLRVGMQLEENERGMGVIGLAEADFLQPTHNKQDFDDTTAYRRLLKKLSDVLSEYWWEKKERVHDSDLQLESRVLRRGINVSTSEDIPDVIWVQCDNPTCLKWRILPPGTDVTVLPDIWYCEYHPDVKYRSHDEPEQDWDTSVQHEIIERRKERKREYDREKKEREAERKRQRLAAASKESQEVLQKWRDTFAKVLQEQEARKEQAQKDQKQREEEMKKLNEDYAAVEARHDEMLKQHKELAKQLELAHQELAQKSKENEESVLISAQVVKSSTQTFPSVEASDGSAASMAFENGHAVQGEIEHTLCNVGNSHGRTFLVVKKASGRQDPSGPSVVVSCSPALLPISDSDHEHQVTLEANGDVHGHQANSLSQPDTLGNSDPTAVPPADTISKPRDVQATKLSCNSKTSLVGLSKEFNSRGNSATTHPQLSQCKGPGLSSTAGCIDNLDSFSSEKLRRPCTAVHHSQRVSIRMEGAPSGKPQVLCQRLETRGKMSSGEIHPEIVATMPSTFSPNCYSTSSYQTSTLAPLQPANPDMLITLSYVPDQNQQLPEGLTTDLEHGSSAVLDYNHQDMLAPIVKSNGVSLEHPIGDIFSELEGVENPSEIHQYRERRIGDHASLGSGAPLSGLRLAPPPGCCTGSLGAGMIAVHLPMDTMVSTSYSRSEAELTLDKAVFSLQRRLRLALNTLVRLGGSVDSNLFELDVLPGHDSEVVSICEKATAHVETRMKNYRHEVASLKAELAYLMADKMQQGQGQNFKIQHISRKWGIGMETLKRG